jgi:hypothetical protein
MKRFLSIWSYLLIPLFIPALVCLWYFIYADFYESQQILNSMFFICLITIVIPLLIYSLLKIFRVVSSIHLYTTRERITPLIAYGILLLILIRTSMSGSLPLALYYFFIGILLATCVAIAMSLLKYKMSLHMMGMGGAMGFVLMLSIALGTPAIYLLAVLSILTGLTGSSRLVMQAHRGHELIFGWTTGLICQILSGSYLVQAL